MRETMFDDGERRERRGERLRPPSPTPMTRPPEPSSDLPPEPSGHRGERVLEEPLEMLPMVDRITIEAAETPNSSMTAR